MDDFDISTLPVRRASHFICVEDAAALLGISRSLAYSLVNQWLTTGTNGLPSIRLGRRILVKRAALDAFAALDG